MNMHTAVAAPAMGQGKKRVDVHGRIFFVKLAEDGAPQSIAERKRCESGWRNNTYWHRIHRMGGPNTLVRRVLVEAGVDTRHLTGH